MRILLHPLFLVCLSGFIINQLLEENGIFIPFVHAYADDVCAMPVLLTLASAAMSLIYFSKRSMQFRYRLSGFQVFFALIYCSIVFEFVLPRFSAVYIADFLDLAAYSFGAMLFYIFINPPKPETANR